MEQINIFSGKRPISRVVTSVGIKDMNQCLEPYRNVFAVVDRNVADQCPAVSQLMEILKGCSRICVDTGAPSVMTYVKINYAPSGVLTMEEKTTKHREAIV